MFEEFYGMYGPKEQEVVALIKRCIGGGYHNKGDFWGMTVVTLGMVFCDTGKASPKEERLGGTAKGAGDAFATSRSAV